MLSSARSIVANSGLNNRCLLSKISNVPRNKYLTGTASTDAYYFISFPKYLILRFLLSNPKILQDNGSLV